MIELRPITTSQVGFVFECLKQLRGGVVYTLSEFQEFLINNKMLDHSEFKIWIGFEKDKPVGILTCNRFAMSRYLGFGYEIEEVVIHSSLQGKGYGKQFIEIFLKWVEKDLNVRKVLVKTDDHKVAGRLYKKYFDIVQTSVFSKGINYL